MLYGEPENTNFIVFGLTRPGLEGTIYRNWGERANRYNTLAVNFFLYTDMFKFNVV